MILNFTTFVVSIGGSVVECSPATRAARVRFPADAILLFYFFYLVTFSRHIFYILQKTHEVVTDDAFLLPLQQQIQRNRIK